MFITAPTDNITSTKDWPRHPAELLDQYATAPAANVGDVFDRLLVLDSGIRCLTNNTRLVGTALPILTRAGDNLAIHYALDDAQPGDVLVINGQGDLSRALIGDLIGGVSKRWSPKVCSAPSSTASSGHCGNPLPARPFRLRTRHRPGRPLQERPRHHRRTRRRRRRRHLRRRHRRRRRQRHHDHPRRARIDRPGTGQRRHRQRRRATTAHPRIHRQLTPEGSCAEGHLHRGESQRVPGPNSPAGTGNSRRPPGAWPHHLFHPPDERGPARAARIREGKQICRTCPVLNQCLTHALTIPEPYGIWVDYPRTNVHNN